MTPTGWLVILTHPLEPLKKSIAPSAKPKIEGKKVKERKGYEIVLGELQTMRKPTL